MKIQILKLTCLLVVCLSLSGCPNGFDGNQFRNNFRNSMAGEDEGTRRRVSRGTRGHREIDPNGVVDEFVQPCHSCENNDMAGRATTRRSSNRLERNFTKMGGDPKALKHALCFFNAHKNTRFRSAAGGRVSIKERCKIAINDYANRGGLDKRMFIVNTCTGNVDVMRVARGKGGYSNTHGSKATPDGFHITGGWHYGGSNKRWYPGIKMHGLQRGVNNNTFARGVVIHRALTSGGGSYCAGGYRSSNRHSNGNLSGDCGRTWGCPGVDPNNWNKVVRDLKGNNRGGTLVYNYTPNMKRKGRNYCGDRLWR